MNDALPTATGSVAGSPSPRTAALTGEANSGVASSQVSDQTVDIGPIENRFAQLPESLFTHLAATPIPDPYWVGISAAAAAEIGMSVDDIAEPARLSAFAGNQALAGSRPLAAVYSGHQFGVWAGQLGDGRALLLGDIAGPKGRWELQLKGSGKTPYSRMGDGRAVLRSSIREFLCSEAMHALGIPTTRALCVVGSDLPVIRESIETAAVTTRMAPSFIRFGSFEHWYYRERIDELRRLTDFTIENYFPEIAASTNVYGELLRTVTRRTAEMIAAWQAVGFCHGVMNTDNMSILGLTLDYGPFGFMESFDPRYICNHSDENGRYSYQMQPRVAHWNLYCLAQALLPLIGSMDGARDALAPFQVTFDAALGQRMRAKLGLSSHRPDDDALISRLMELLAAQAPDYTVFFRSLCQVSAVDTRGDDPVRELVIEREALESWLDAYRERLRLEDSDDSVRQAAMRAVNPKFILRNYLAEVAIRRAQERDFSEVHRLLAVLERPFDEQPENEQYAALPPDWAHHLQLSCSS